MQNVFNSVSVERPKYSYFDLSYDHKLTCKMGQLIPVHVQECLPTDKFQQSSQALLRLAPMLAPIMHKVDVYMHYFFVPNRILWPNWEKFIAPETDDAIPPKFPVLDLSDPLINDFNTSTLADYLGCPTNVTNVGTYGVRGISAMPFAAYQKIYDEFYRDQNVEDENFEELVDGIQVGQAINLCALRRRAWEHDYFTSCLPEPQKGPDVLMPLNFSQPTIPVTPVSGIIPSAINAMTGAPFPAMQDLESNVLNSELFATDGITPAIPFNIDFDGSQVIDTSMLTGTTTLADLRTAAAIQRYLERASRVGTRYKEVLEGFFGARTSDARLQRPEYLGGAKSTMAISEVLQTSETDSTPQGNMAGHGLSVSQGNVFDYYCEEHGFIIGLMSIMPKTAYYQGLPKHFSKTLDRYEYFWPDLQNIGEEPVYNREIFVTGGDVTTNEKVFGYLPRYSEYRYNPGRVSGMFRNTMDDWHLGRSFSTVPLLSQPFIACDPSKRIFAVDDPNLDDVWVHVYHKISARRPITKYGDPGSII